MTNILFGPHRSTRGSLSNKNTVDLCQEIVEIEESTQRPDSGRPVNDVGSVLKTAKADRLSDDDKVDVDEGPKPTKKAKRPPNKRKVRISAENLPKIMRAKKRASVKARRSTMVPHRISSGPPPRTSLKKRKTSIGPKSSDAIKPSASDSKPCKCPVFGCEYAGARANYLKTHMKRHDKEKLVNCKKCDMKFKSADGILLAKHLADHK